MAELYLRLGLLLGLLLALGLGLALAIGGSVMFMHTTACFVWRSPIKYTAVHAQTCVMTAPMATSRERRRAAGLHGCSMSGFLSKDSVVVSSCARVLSWDAWGAGVL